MVKRTPKNELKTWSPEVYQAVLAPRGLNNARLAEEARNHDARDRALSMARTTRSSPDAVTAKFQKKEINGAYDPNGSEEQFERHRLAHSRSSSWLSSQIQATMPTRRIVEAQRTVSGTSSVSSLSSQSTATSPKHGSSRAGSSRSLSKSSTLSSLRGSGEKLIIQYVEDTHCYSHLYLPKLHCVAVPVHAHDDGDLLLIPVLHPFIISEVLRDRHVEVESLELEPPSNNCHAKGLLVWLPSNFTLGLVEFKEYQHGKATTFDGSASWPRASSIRRILEDDYENATHVRDDVRFLERRRSLSAGLMCA